MKINKVLVNIAFFALPVIFIMGLVFVETSMPLDQKKYFYSEFGILEIVHELGLLLSICLAIWLLLNLNAAQPRWLKIWLGLAFIGCFYSLGEEISWGQTFFNWQTPETWARLNGQEETNLHNMSHLLNQLPKAILEIGVLIGGIIIPALQKWAPHKLPAQFSAAYPLSPVVFTALIALGIKLLEIPVRFDYEIFLRKSEVMETALFYFVLVYLISLVLKWRQEGRLKP